MGKLVNLTRKNIKPEYIRTIYKWRFESYINNFSSNEKPTYTKHEEYLMNEINTENIEWYGLIDDEKLIACCSTEKNTDLLGVVEYTLGRVMVDPTKRRQKLGSVMIEQCITEMKRTDKSLKSG